MNFKNYTFSFLLFIGTLVFPAKLLAQSYAFIYIESDKDLLFRVKTNTELATQYSKHYCIIPKIIPGTHKLYITFPNGDYAPLRFMIEVPEKGFRNFLLTRYEGSISLYDIQNLSYQSGEMVTMEQVQNDFPGKKSRKTHYLQDSYNDESISNVNDSNTIIVNPNNNNNMGRAIFSNDVALPQSTENKVNKTTQSANTLQETDIPPSPPTSLDSEALADFYNNPVNNPNKVKINPTKTYAQVATSTDDFKTPEAKSVLDSEALADFYNNPVNNRNKQKITSSTSTPSPIKTSTSNNTAVKLNNYGKSSPTITTTTTTTRVQVRKVEVGKCNAPLQEKLYDDIYINTLQKGEKVRLKYLLSCLNNCYSCSQIRVLTTTLTTDPERYAFLKQAYARICDKNNFPSLESTIVKKEWKDILIFFKAFILYLLF
jgi:Domain of unknown function (DUF4476)